MYIYIYQGDKEDDIVFCPAAKTNIIINHLISFPNRCKNKDAVRLQIGSKNQNML